MDKRPEEKRRLTDSPWFWGYIFSTAALIGLALAAPKYRLRQTQLERRFLARQEGGQTIKGTDGATIEKPTGNNLILRLGPLFLIVGSLLVVAWSRLWWSRVVPGAGTDPANDATTSTDEAIAESANPPDD